MGLFGPFFFLAPFTLNNNENVLSNDFNIHLYINIYFQLLFHFFFLIHEPVLLIAYCVHFSKL